MNNPRGSMWRKWDLHVHSPDSLFQEYSGADPWISEPRPELKLSWPRSAIHLKTIKGLAVSLSAYLTKFEGARMSWPFMT